jgi:hypothetical protein
MAWRDFYGSGHRYSASCGWLFWPTADFSVHGHHGMARLAHVRAVTHHSTHCLLYSKHKNVDNNMLHLVCHDSRCAK